jgi:quinol monooxygenase YgiN
MVAGQRNFESLSGGKLRVMVKTGLLVRLEAAPGKEADVERLLTGILARVQREAATRVWMAIRLGPSSFGIVNAFPDATARNAHLAGEVASRLKDIAAELLASPLRLEEFEILASKLPR